VYVSGQVPSGESLAEGDENRQSGEQDDMRARAHAAFDEIASHLEKLGGSLSDVVRMTAYLTDLSTYKVFSEVRAARFADGLPASTAFQVAGIIGGETLEVDAVAFIADA
jgi:enamine deaminase RidA (YjgF/YER057c/UK114 family)